MNGPVLPDTTPLAAGLAGAAGDERLRIRGVDRPEFQPSDGVAVLGLQQFNAEVVVERYPLERLHGVRARRSWLTAESPLPS